MIPSQFRHHHKHEYETKQNRTLENYKVEYFIRLFEINSIRFPETYIKLKSSQYIAP